VTQQISICSIDLNSFEQEVKIEENIGIAFVHQTDSDNLRLVDISSLSSVYPYIEPMSDDAKGKLPKELELKYANIFSKAEADLLPEHRPYDCSIPILEGR